MSAWAKHPQRGSVAAFPARASAPCTHRGRTSAARRRGRVTPSARRVPPPQSHAAATGCLAPRRQVVNSVPRRCGGTPPTPGRPRPRRSSVPPHTTPADAAENVGEGRQRRPTPVLGGRGSVGEAGRQDPPTLPLGPHRIRCQNPSLVPTYPPSPFSPPHPLPQRPRPSSPPSPSSLTLPFPSPSSSPSLSSSLLVPPSLSQAPSPSAPHAPRADEPCAPRPSRSACGGLAVPVPAQMAVLPSSVPLSVTLCRGAA